MGAFRKCFEATSLFKVEPTEESGGLCSCCGNQTRTFWGLIYEQNGAVASYFVQWTVGQPLDSHPVNFDLIYGSWGEGTTKKDRCAVSLVYFENEAGPGVMIVDAHDRPVAYSELTDTVLKRDEVVGTDLAKQVFALFDAVWLQDKRVH